MSKTVLDTPAPQEITVRPSIFICAAVPAFALVLLALFAQPCKGEVMQKQNSGAAPVENWSEEDEERMRNIMQNGNEGLHYKNLPHGKRDCDAAQIDILTEDAQ